MFDNPIWTSLTTQHAGLAEGGNLARRYPAHIGPLAGMREASMECFEALAPLATDVPVALFSVEPVEPPAGWKVMRRGPMVQMVRAAQVQLCGDDGTMGVRLLTAADAPAMVALAELTEPGPFRLRTIELGNFYGLFHNADLVSMAGRRMHLPGYVEVSGVCTRPEARGRGYARRLMSIVIGEIEDAGETAFLHAYADNPAIGLYEQMGFTLNRRMHFMAVVRKL